MRTTILALALLTLQACDSSGGGGSASVAPSVPTAQAPSQQNPALATTSGPAPASVQSNVQTIDVTYFSLAKTETSGNGEFFKSPITMTGFCMVYLSKTYCWDDGLKTVPSYTQNNNTYAALSFTYWGLGGPNVGPCSGGCASDPLTAPTHVGVVLSANIQASSINEVFNLGTSTQVTCTEAGSVLDCGTFKLDTAKADLQ